ncbi:MAG: circadian clock KaiB family protein [Chloroflexi bacterium]|nr:circadian clock KaiB family protein [Chloroflexota bacterium]
MKLKLYITGRDIRSEQAIVQIQRMCRTYLADQYELEVVDVAENPELAEADGILATPTLIRLEPLPAVRIVGDLSHEQDVLKQLEIQW